MVVNSQRENPLSGSSIYRLSLLPNAEGVGGAHATDFTLLYSTPQQAATP